MLLSHAPVCLDTLDSACCFCGNAPCVNSMSLTREQSWGLRKYPELYQRDATDNWIAPVLCGDCHALIVCTLLTCAECHKVAVHDHTFADVAEECWPDCPTIFEETAPLCGDCFDVLNQVECEVCGKPTSAKEKHIITQTDVDVWICRPEYTHDKND